MADAVWERFLRIQVIRKSLTSLLTKSPFYPFVSTPATANLTLLSDGY